MVFSAEHESLVVGFDFSGDELLSGHRLDFRDGLTVLYGLNGTGKSRLLRGVRAALSGVESDVSIGLIARCCNVGHRQPVLR